MTIPHMGHPQLYRRPIPMYPHQGMVDHNQELPLQAMGLHLKDTVPHPQLTMPLLQDTVHLPPNLDTARLPNHLLDTHPPTDHEPWGSQLHVLMHEAHIAHMPPSGLQLAHVQPIWHWLKRSCPGSNLYCCRFTFL